MSNVSCWYCASCWYLYCYYCTSCILLPFPPPLPRIFQRLSVNLTGLLPPPLSLLGTAPCFSINIDNVIVNVATIFFVNKVRMRKNWFLKFENQHLLLVLRRLPYLCAGDEKCWKFRWEWELGMVLALREIRSHQLISVQSGSPTTLLEVSKWVGEPD